MKTTLHFVFLALLLMTFGCKEKDVLLDKDFEIRIGQTAIINDGALEIKFLEVLEDNRCPKGMFCITQGGVRVKLLATDNTRESELELSTYSLEKGDEERQVEFGPYRIEILDVSPDNVQKLDSKKYKITLNVKVL